MKIKILYKIQLIIGVTEDTTGTIDTILLEKRHKYFNVPEIEITEPSLVTGVEQKQ